MIGPGKVTQTERKGEGEEANAKSQPSFSEVQTKHLLAKTRADAAPMNPKNGAEVGQVSYDTVAIFNTH